MGKGRALSWPCSSGGFLKSQEWKDTTWGERGNREAGEAPLGKAVHAAVVGSSDVSVFPTAQASPR